MNKPEIPESSLVNFLKNSITITTIFITFIGTIKQFINLYQNKDDSWHSIGILFTCVALILFASYYYAFKYPEKPASRRNKNGEKHHSKTKYIRIQCISKAIFYLAITLSIIFSIYYWLVDPFIPPAKNIILVANFKEENQSSEILTNTILKELRNATKSYPEIKVKYLDRTITDKQGEEIAKNLGKKHKAKIVIWGWYGKPPSAEKLALSAGFELIEPPETIPKIGLEVVSKELNDRVQWVAEQDIKDGKIYIDVPNKINYLSLFTLGMIRQSTSEWDKSIQYFNKIIESYPQANSKGTAHYFRGYSFSQKGEIESAINDFNKAIELDKDLVPAYTGRADIYRTSGDYDLSIKDYNRAIYIDNKDKALYNNRGLIHIDMEEYKKAIYDFSKAIDLDKKLEFPYLNRANAYLNIGDFKSALIDYEYASKDRSTLNLADVGRANLFFKKGDFKTAEKYFNRSLKRKSKHKEILYLFRGIFYFSQKRIEESISDFNIILGDKNDYKSLALPEKDLYVAAYDMRANSYSYLGDQKQAIKDKSEAIKLLETSPNSLKRGWLYNNRGIIFMKNNQYENAIDDFSKAIDLENFPAAYLNRSKSYFRTKEFSKSISDIREVIKNDYLERGTLYLEKRDYSSAFSDYSPVISDYPDDYLAYSLRGQTNESISLYIKDNVELLKQALSDYTKYIQLKPNELDAYISRSRIYRNSGKLVLAKNDIERAISIESNNPRPYHERGIIHFDMGKIDLAKSDFKKVITLEPDNTFAKDWLEIISRPKISNKSDQSIVPVFDKEEVKYIESEIAIYTNELALHLNSRAAIYMEMGKLNLAQDDLNTSINNNKYFSKAYFNRGMIFKSLQDKKRAQLDFKKIISLNNDKNFVDLAKAELKELK